MQTLITPATSWSQLEKIAFRFCFLYFLIYIFFNPNDELPVINLLYEQVNNLMHRFIPWFARNIFGYKDEMIMEITGSGDTTYYYMLWFFTILVAITGTLLWTLLDRKRKSYNTLYYWIRVLVRYYLFYTMVMYGMFKVIKLQFPYPSLDRLVQPYGDSSPMGLAWTYLGYSGSYNYYTGIAELLGGVLMLSRRTTTLGALVCLGVMSNVFMINMGYDVPVKLLSLHTILMSIFLLWKDGKRLAAFFFLNKPTAASDIAPPYTGKKIKYTLLTIKLLFIIFIVGVNLSNAIPAQWKYGEKMPKPPLYGIYYTEDFVRNNESVPPLGTDTTRWKRLVISYPGYAKIQMMNDSTKWYNLQVDTVAKTVTVSPLRDTLSKTFFSYTTEPPYLIFSGVMKNDSTRIKFKRFDEKKFRLTGRGFRWVSEYPYNR